MFGFPWMEDRPFFPLGRNQFLFSRAAWASARTLGEGSSLWAAPELSSLGAIRGLIINGTFTFGCRLELGSVPRSNYL